MVCISSEYSSIVLFVFGFTYMSYFTWLFFPNAMPFSLISILHIYLSSNAFELSITVLTFFSKILFISMIFSEKSFFFITGVMVALDLIQSISGLFLSNVPYFDLMFVCPSLGILNSLVVLLFSVSIKNSQIYCKYTKKSLI